MFYLTQRERRLLAVLLLAFVTGLAVKYVRQQSPTTPPPGPNLSHANHRF